MEPILYIVATPIGTLSDLSERARQVLADVSFIACEDTRHTGKLLAHFGIRTHLESLHEHNERERSEALVHRLLGSEQQCAAVVTDAGTPCISDPGAVFVRTARAMGVRVLSVPGPSSVVSALAASGFLERRHLFSGFLGRSSREQEDEFTRWRAVAPCVAVFFESPQRLLDSLNRIKSSFGDTLEVCVSKEISKTFEEHVCGSLAEVISNLTHRERIQGEYAVCVHLTAEQHQPQQPHLSMDDAAAQIFALIKSGAAMGKRPKELVKEFARQHDLDARSLYKQVESLRDVVEQDEGEIET